MASRGNPKNVKNFNNALHKPFFPIPLLQVNLSHTRTCSQSFMIHVLLGMHTWSTHFPRVVLSSLQAAGR